MKDRIRQYLPDPQQVRKTRSLRWLGSLLHQSQLWHFNRRSIANAFAVGFFSMWMPIPFQMVLAALLSIAGRANLPLSIALVWLTNPITAPPMFYGAYLFGSWVLQHDVQLIEFNISVDWLIHDLGQIWQPFLLGCLLLGIASALLGYVSVRLAWRYYVYQALQRRNANNVSE